jgi:hypothetical protein
MSKAKRKVLIGHIYSCELNDVLCKKDGYIEINEDVMPFTNKKLLDGRNRFCNTHGKHGIVKVRLTIEEIK